jgi:hypothetical protein
MTLLGKELGSDGEGQTLSRRECPLAQNDRAPIIRPSGTEDGL